MSFGGLSPTSLDDVSQEKVNRSTGGQRTRRGGGNANPGWMSSRSAGGNTNAPYSDFCRTQRNNANTLNPRVANLLKNMQDLGDDDCSSSQNGGLGDFEPLDPPSQMKSKFEKGFENQHSNTFQDSTLGLESIPQDKMRQLQSLKTIKRNQIRSGSENAYGGEIEGMKSSSTDYENNQLQSVYLSDQEIENYYQKFVPNYQTQQQQQQQPQQQQPQQSKDTFSFPSFVNEKKNKKKEGLINLSNPSNLSNSEYDNDALVQKLNYMIHLLEDKQDMKTGTAMEEMILYCLLGIFVIFLVDSFSKVGKYVR